MSGELISVGGSEIPEQPIAPPTEGKNRPEWLPEKFSNEQELAKAYAELEKRMRRADMVYEELAMRHRTLQSTHDSLKEMHTDALAVIRYLENKLYVALQQVVKNGRNS